MRTLTILCLLMLGPAFAGAKPVAQKTTKTYEQCNQETHRINPPRSMSQGARRRMNVACMNGTWSEKQR